MRVAFVATLAHSASVRRLAGVGPLVPGNVALAAERSGAHRARGEMGAGASSSAPQVGLTMLCPFESIQAVHRPFHDPLQTAHTLHPLFFLCSFRPTWCLPSSSDLAPAHIRSCGRTATSSPTAGWPRWTGSIRASTINGFQRRCTTSEANASHTCGMFLPTRYPGAGLARRRAVARNRYVHHRVRIKFTIA